MTWGMPQNFSWLWVLPALVLIYWFSNRRRKSLVRAFGEEELMGRLLGAYDPSGRIFKRCALFLSVLGIVIALCQPHYKTKEVVVERRGIDIMIALDVSQSMLAKDIAPTRLEKAKLELSGLIQRLKQDRIGIIAFAGDAYIQCPLTLDKSAAKLFLSTVGPALIPLPGTDIGKAIDTSLNSFTDKDKKFKAIIVLTDGEDHGGRAREAASRAKDAGVKIYVIGLGTKDGSIVPADDTGQNFKKDREGKAVLSRLDEALLREISQKTGGIYYRSTRGELETDHLLRELRLLGQKGFQKDKSIEYEEHYQYFLIGALIFLMAEMILSERKRERISARIGMILLMILLSPALAGFKFYSAVKNEEGNKYYKKNQIGKAKTSYEQALKSEPTQPEIAYNLGNVLYKEESYDQSLDSYKKAASDEKNKTAFFQSRTFYNIGNVLYRKNEKEKAREFYKQALRINPKDEDAKYNLEILNQSKNKSNQPNKQDPQRQQNKQDQSNSQDQKNQGESGGGQDQEGQDEKNQGGQSKDSNKEESKDAQSQGSRSEEKNDTDKKDGQASFGGGSGKENKKDNASQGESQQDEPQKNENNDKPAPSSNEGDKEKQDKNDGSAEKNDTGQTSDQKPATPEEMRDQQILDALEGQEKQTLKYGRLNSRNRQRVRPYVEKDW